MRRAILCMAAAASALSVISPMRAYVVDSKRWDAGNVTMHLNLDATPLARPLADGSTSWTQVAEQALNDWNANISKTKFVAVPHSTAAIGKQNGINNVFWGSTVYGEAWGNGVVGLTITVTQSGSPGRRVESDVIFNSGIPFNSYRGALGSAGATLDFKRVALHEFGHVLGLDHPDDFGQSKIAVMNSFVSDIDRLMADDIEGAQSGYGPTTPPAASATTAPSIVSLSGVSGAVAGSSVAFSVVVSGTAPFSYQWKKNGTAMIGATSASLLLESVQSFDSGSYSVTISNSSGNVSAGLGSFTVTVSAPAIVSQPANRTVSVGSNTSFGVTVTGSATLSYQWSKSGVAIPGATAATLNLLNVQVSDAGAYSVLVSNSAGMVRSSTATLSAALDVVSTGSSQLTNVSVRTTLAPHANLIFGLTMAGGSKPVLVRAVGPSLAAFGVKGVMADPMLAVFKDGSRIDGNDNWDGGASLGASFASVGAFPLPATSLDAALLRSIEGGNTVKVSSAEGGTVLVEAYDAGMSTHARLTNISARNHVGKGGDALIAGFTISGNAPKTVLIRGIGPTLAAYGVAGTLADPKLELYSGSNKIGENDTWPASLSPTFTHVGAFGLTAGSKDAALIVTLSPGGYTVQLSGSDGGVGEGMIEIYEIETETPING